MSVLTPVFSSPVEAIAIPPAQSTIVALTEPCRPLLELSKFSVTGNLATMDPFSALTISMFEKKKLYTGEPEDIRAQQDFTLSKGDTDMTGRFLEVVKSKKEADLMFKSSRNQVASMDSNCTSSIAATA